MVTTICPICHKTFKNYRNGHGKYKTHCSVQCRGVSLRKPASPRNLEIVEFNKTHTLDVTGQKYGLTRERIRQIVKRSTGHGSSYKELMMQKKKIRIQEKIKLKAIEDAQVRLICPVCKVPVLFGESTKKAKRCRKCQDALNHGRALETVKCDNCGRLYHPWRNFQNIRKERPGIHQFCCHSCTVTWIHVNGRAGMNKVVLPEAEVAKFIRQGWRISDIAKHYNRHWNTIRDCIRRSPYLSGLLMLTQKKG